MDKYFEILPFTSNSLIYIQMEDGCVVYVPEKRRICVLNSLAQRVLSFCDGKTLLEHVVELLSKETGANPSLVQKDVEELLGEMLEEGIVKYSTQN
jgi:oxalate decarboxylase/phosphoglucose isomerase-like protein (cupin superfamily)